MRVAAVQLTSTADLERNLATADRLTRAAAADGAQLVVLPEKWAVLGRPRRPPPAPSRSTGRALTWARAAARELGIDLVAGSISERVPDASKGSNTSRPHRPRRRGPRGLPQAAHVRRRRRRHAPTASPSTRSRATRSSVARPPSGVELGLTRLLRPPLPRAVPDPRRARRAHRSPCPPPSRCPPRATTGRSCCAPGRSRTRRSWSPPTRSASTRPGCAPAGAR